MGGKSTPAAPDYTGAAQEQAKSSRQVTEQQSWANRPDQVTPFGTESWGNKPTWDPATGQYLNRWTQTTNLTPESQSALDSQLRLAESKSRLGEQLTGRLQNDFSAPMDWNKLPQAGASVNAPNYGDIGSFRNRQEENLYNRAKSRLDPEWNQRADATRTQMYNAGAREGDTAYDQGMGNFERARTDAYNQALYGAIAGGGAETANQIGMGGQIQGQQQGASAYDTQIRQQAIAEQLQQRGMTLNEINAIMSGQQVNMPNMPSFSQAQAAQPVQSLQAAQLTGQAALDAFNAKQQASQGMMSGIGSIAGAAAMFSSRKLKKNIVQIGKLISGIPVYVFDYLWGETAIGVILEEIPRAFVFGNRVNYRALLEAYNGLD